MPKIIVGASDHSNFVEKRYAKDEINKLINKMSVSAGDRNREATKDCLHDLKKYLEIVASALKSEAEKVRAQ